MGKLEASAITRDSCSYASSSISRSGSDEDSLSDYQYRFETDWCLGSISPNPDSARGYRAGTTFSVFCASILPNSRKPLSFSLQLQCQVELYTARLGHRFGEPEPPDWNRCDDKHEILLDSLQLDVDAPVGAPVASNEVRHGKYRVPLCGQCACGTGETERWLPSSCEDGPVVVRYWFNLTAHTGSDAKARSGWKGKLASIGDKQYSLRIPVRIVADKSASPMLSDEALSAGLDVGGLSRFEREDELYTIRRFLEKGPQPLLGPDLPCPTLRLIHRVTTAPAGPASLSMRLEVSAGVHIGNDLLQAEQTLASLVSATDFRLVRRTTMVLPVQGNAAAGDTGKDKGKGKAKALPLGVSLQPLVDQVTIGRVRVTRRDVCREMRLVGSADEPGVRAHELFLVFDGDLVLPPGDFAQGLPCPKSREKLTAPSALPIRVETCRAEVRYDLIAEVGIACRDSLRQIRACDVRVDLRGAGSEPDSPNSDSDFDDDDDSDESESETAELSRKDGLPTSVARGIDIERYPALAALYGTGSVSPVAAIPNDSAENSLLPPYEPSSSPTAAVSRGEKRTDRDTHAALPAFSLSQPAAPADTAAPPSYQSSEQALTTFASPSTSSRGPVSSFFPSSGREFCDAAPSLPAASSSNATASVQPPSSAASATEPPSWNDAVQEDIAGDWALANLALGADDPPASEQDLQARASRSRSEARGTDM